MPFKLYLGIARKAQKLITPLCVLVFNALGMAHSLMLLATRVVEIMFFTGLVGCAIVVVVSWVSIFGDGFSDLLNRESDSHWESSQYYVSGSKSSESSSVSLF